MLIGRIEAYLHSDVTTSHKGGVLVRVTAQTDFAARTEVFIAFAHTVAKLAYAAQATTWDAVIAMFPDLEVTRLELQTSLREPIVVDAITLLTL